MKYFLFSLLLSLVGSPLQGQELIKFKSSDGIEITADYYKMHPDTATLIVLFHQAGWSRGEYVEIAPKLNARGYNCLAVDLRSGSEVNGVKNTTHQNAQSAMKETSYLDAYIDVASAIKYSRDHLAKGEVIIWGSSYSSSLVLRYGGEGDVSVTGILSFSPGEYFKNLGKPGDYIQSFAKDIEVPVFITSARSESGSWSAIFEAIPLDRKSSFLPTSSGNHGSRALWSKFTDHKAYWEAVDSFLSSQ